jgi:transposase
MYIDIVPNRGSPPAVLLREGWREGEKIRKRTLANLTAWPAPKVELLRRLLRDEPLLAPEGAFSIERSLPHGHVEAVLAAIRHLGMDTLLGTKRSPERDLVLAMIAERLIYPCSKLATTRLWHSTTLAQELDVAEADEEALYAAMDWLLKRQERIEKKLAARHLGEGSQVLYDVSSSYYEGHTCPLMQFGHNRDGKRDLPIVVYGVLADAEGRPVAVEAYPGNTADPSTVPDQVVKLKERFGLQRLVLVGDRGMLTQTRIETLKEYPGIGWISALRNDKLRQLAEEGVLQPALFDVRNLAEIRSEAFPGERLIACFNPALAAERKRKREALLQATEEALAKIRQEVQRRTKTPLSAAQIGQKVGRVIARHKMGKHFALTVGDGQFDFARRTAAIAQEAHLDGLYVIRTSEPLAQLAPAQAVRSYKGLAQVERAFRTLKSMDLRIRPIHHRTEERVRAHIFLCLLAYYVEWHLRRAWASLLFDDETWPDDRQERDPVAPAAPSENAKRKKTERLNAEGLPIHSFHTLMAELATRCRHLCRLQADPDTPLVTHETEPTPLQVRALELLRMLPVIGS